MRFWQLTCFAAAFAASPLCVTVVAKIPTGQSNLAAEVGVTEQPPSFFILSATPATFSQRFSVLLQEEESVNDNPNEKQARLEQEDFSFRDHSDGATSAKLVQRQFSIGIKTQIRRVQACRRLPRSQEQRGLRLACYAL